MTAAGTAAALSDYLQGKPCPKCGYARQGRNDNPDWQCPQCGIAYLKFRADRPAAVKARLAQGSRELAADARLDRSTLVLIAANVLATGIALSTGMSLREMMLVYWLQSVAIGLSFFVRMRALRRFTTEGLKINGREAAPTAGTRLQVSFFFLVHYGTFHGAYLAFLLAGSGGESLRLTDQGLWLCAAGFALSHLFSLLENLRLDREGTPNIGTLMMLPYARILPMHITIVLGGTIFGGPIALLLFTLLKCGADVIMHLIEHRVLRGGPRQPAIVLEP